jgi:hypothetical protein
MPDPSEIAEFAADLVQNNRGKAAAPLKQMMRCPMCEKQHEAEYIAGCWVIPCPQWWGPEMMIDRKMWKL